MQHMQDCNIIFAKMSTGIKRGRIVYDIHWSMLCRSEIYTAAAELTMMTDQGSVKLMRQEDLVGATDGLLRS